MRSWADPSTSVATTLSITTSAATTASRYHYYTEEFLPLLFSTWQKFHGRVSNQSETSQKPVRNRPNATSLSLPCLFPHPPTRTPISTTTTASATATASAAGTTVSFPDRFRTAQAYFAPKFEIECVHAWILTLITRFATTLSTTTTPAATAPPLPLVHLGISAFAFKSNWHESRWRVRNQSETRQKPAKRNHLFPPSLPLSLSLSLFPSLSLSSLALLLELLFLLLLLLLPLLLLLLLLLLLRLQLLRLLLRRRLLLLLLLVLLVLLVLLLLVLLWVFRTVSGPRKLILPPNLKSNAFTHGSSLYNT